MSTSIALISENEYTSVPCSMSLDSFVSCVGLRAPQFVPSDTLARAGMDIVAVLDRSGSMAGEKMKMLHETVQLMIDNLKDIDRLSLVSYDDREEVNLPLMCMDKLGKQRAKVALQQIRDRGSTNLSGGLWKGLQVLAERVQDKNEVASVLLLTDGLANAGVTDPTQLVEQTVQRLSAMNNPTSIYCFGFGSDHNSTLLSSLSQAAHGTYYFLKTSDSIPLAFADCLGGLMSVIAQNIVLTITAVDDTFIKAVTTSYAVTEIAPNRQFCVAIGDLFSEEERDVLVDIRVAERAAPEAAQPLLVCNIRYINVISEGSEQVEHISTIERTDSTALGQMSIKVDQERNRVRTAEAMVQAQQLGDQGHLDEARAVLELCQQQITVSPSAQNPASAAYLQDLSAVHSRMVSQSMYAAEGGHRLRNKSAKYSAQRACESDETEVQAFMTPTKMGMRALFKK